MRPIHALLASLLILSLTAFTGAQPAPAPAAAAPKADSGIASFLDDKTVLVGQVDMGRVDMDVAFKWFVDAAKQAEVFPPADMADVEKDMQRDWAEATRWVKEFKEAGGRYLLVIGRSDTLQRNGPVVVVPLSEGANADQIRNLFLAGSKDGKPQNRGNDVAIIQGKAVIFGGNRRVVDAFVKAYSDAKNQGGKPSEQLLAAWGAVDQTAAGQMVFVPDQAVRNLVLQNMPPNVLGQPKAQLVESVSWVGASAGAPPDPKGRLVIQPKDAAAQQTILQTVTLGFGMLKAMKGQPGAPANIEDLTNLLMPMPAEGDRLALEADTAKFVTFLKSMAPVFREERKQAMRWVAMSNMRQLLVACVMYAKENKDAWPDDLSKIGKYVGGGQLDKLLTNPRDPARGTKSYKYIKPVTPVKTPATLIVLYEAHEKFPPGGINVGYADGHVEMMNNAQRFKDALLATMEENAANEPAQ